MRQFEIGDKVKHRSDDINVYTIIGWFQGRAVFQGYDGDWDINFFNHADLKIEALRYVIRQMEVEIRLDEI